MLSKNDILISAPKYKALFCLGLSFFLKLDRFALLLVVPDAIFWSHLSFQCQTFTFDCYIDVLFCLDNKTSNLNSIQLLLDLTISRPNTGWSLRFLRGSGIFCLKFSLRCHVIHIGLSFISFYFNIAPRIQDIAYKKKN